MKPLPHCDEIFLTFFDRWYRKEDRKRKGVKATRPDLMENSKLAGQSASQLSPFDEDSQAEIIQQIDNMVMAAKEDWKTFLEVVEPIDINWVKAFDSYSNQSRVQELIEGSDPEDISNKFLVLCCEFGAVLGYVMRQARPSLEWLADAPYWESALFEPKKGVLIPVFHWAIKKFSSYGIDDGYAAKIKACLQLLDKKGKIA
jgi:hypothetical protein